MATYYAGQFGITLSIVSLQTKTAITLTEPDKPTKTLKSEKIK